MNMHVSARSNMLGFMLSLVLTLVSFGMAMKGGLPESVALAVIVVAAVVQIVVQMHFFLHLDASPSQRWNVMVAVYTVIIIAFIVAGSLWIMYNTGIRMMPMAQP